MPQRRDLLVVFGPCGYQCLGYQIQSWCLSSLIGYVLQRQEKQQELLLCADDGRIKEGRILMKGSLHKGGQEREDQSSAANRKLTKPMESHESYRLSGGTRCDSNSTSLSTSSFLLLPFLDDDAASSSAIKSPTCATVSGCGATPHPSAICKRSST